MRLGEVDVWRRRVASTEKWSLREHPRSGWRVSMPTRTSLTTQPLVRLPSLVSWLVRAAAAAVAPGVELGVTETCGEKNI